MDFSVSFRWGWILCVALLVPAALPAGGGDLREPKVRKRDFYEPIIANQGWKLLSAPIAAAPSLINLQMGTPLKVLRYWKSSVGKQWIYVEIMESLSGEILMGSIKRGWLNG